MAVSRQAREAKVAAARQEAKVEMAVNDEKRRKNAIEILGQIEVSRQRWGRPKGEDRHPGLDLGISWPVVPKGGQ